MAPAAAKQVRLLYFVVRKLKCLQILIFSSRVLVFNFSIRSVDVQHFQWINLDTSFTINAFLN